MEVFIDWARMLAYITGTVDQELLLRNEYLVAENRTLKAQLKTPLRLTDAERVTLEVLTLRGLVTYYVLFFIHLESRRVEVSGITPHPNERWMKQIA